MTKAELIEFACEIDGGKGISEDQMQNVMKTLHRLAEFSLDEFKSFNNLCAVRSVIKGAAAAAADDLVTLRLTQEQCAFLLALIDQGIRENA